MSPFLFRLYDLLSNEENDDGDMEIATLSSDEGPNSPKMSTKRKASKASNRTIMRFNNFTNQEFTSSSEDEEEVEQKKRLELKNPMFPKI